MLLLFCSLANEVMVQAHDYSHTPFTLHPFILALGAPGYTFSWNFLSHIPEYLSTLYYEVLFQLLKNP